MKHFSRFFVFSLCIVLLMTFCLPLQTYAYTVAPSFTPAQGALFSLFFSSDFVPDVVEEVGPFLQRILDTLVNDPISDYFADLDERDPETFTPTEAMISSVINAAVQVYKRYGDWPFKHASFDISEDVLTSEILVSAGTELYIPTQSQLEHLDALSSSQLIVESLEKNHTVLSRIRLLIYNGFNEIKLLSSALNENILDSISSFQENIVDRVEVISEWFESTFDTITSGFESVLDYLSNLGSSLEEYHSSVIDWFLELNTSVSYVGDAISEFADRILDSAFFSYLESVHVNITESLGSISGWLSDTFDSVSAGFESMHEWFLEVNTSIVSLPQDIADLIPGQISAALSESFTGIKEAVLSVPELFTSAFESFHVSITNSLGSISGWLSDTFDSVSAGFESMHEWFLEVNTSIVSLPQDIADLFIVSFEGIFEWFLEIKTSISDSVSSVIDSIALIPGQISAALSESFTGIKEAVLSVPELVTSAFESFHVSITNSLGSISGWLSDTFDSVSAGFESMHEWFLEVNTSIVSLPQDIFDLFVESFEGIFEWFLEIKTSISDSVSSLWTNIESFFSSCTVAITDAIAVVGSKIDTLIDSIAAFAQPSPEPEPDPDETQPSDGFVAGGVGQGILWFGNANDILHDFGSGLLVAGLIFEEFAGVSFFYRLIIISASVGLVGVLLGVALDASSRDSAKRTADRMKAANKEGFNAGFKAGFERSGGS